MSTQQNAQIFLKQPMTSHQEVDQNRHKKVQIINVKPISVYNETIYQEIIKTFTNFFEDLKKYLPNQEDPILENHNNLKKITNDIISLITQTENKIKEQKKYLLEESSNDNSNQCQSREKPQFVQGQQPQSKGDVDLIENSILKDPGEKQEHVTNKKIEKEGNDNSNKEKQGCIINHKYIKDNLQEYQQIIEALLRLQLRGGPKYLKCLCNKNIIYQDLSISNRNLFDLIENQQLEIIFQNMKNKKILKCLNNFCSFKCVESDLKDQKKQQYYYCPACNDYSIALQ